MKKIYLIIILSFLLLINLTSCKKTYTIKFIDTDGTILSEITDKKNKLIEYDLIAENFRNYISSNTTYFNDHFPNNKKDIIAYFSAEYGLDECLGVGFCWGLGFDFLTTCSSSMAG